MNKSYIAIHTYDRALFVSDITAVLGWFYTTAQNTVFETLAVKRFLYCLHSSIPTAHWQSVPTTSVLLHVRLNSAF